MQYSGTSGINIISHPENVIKTSILCLILSFRPSTSSHLSSLPWVLLCSTPYPHTLLYRSPAPVRKTLMKWLLITQLKTPQTTYCWQTETLRELRHSQQSLHCDWNRLKIEEGLSVVREAAKDRNTKRCPWVIILSSIIGPWPNVSLTKTQFYIVTEEHIFLYLIRKFTCFDILKMQLYDITFFVLVNSIDWHIFSFLFFSFFKRYFFTNREQISPISMTAPKHKQCANMTAIYCLKTDQLLVYPFSFFI